MTTIREIPLQPTRYKRDEGKQLDSAIVLHTYSRYVRHNVRLKLGYITPEGEARQVDQGPLVPGPWVFTYPLSTVIDNFGGTGAERERLQAADLEWDVEVGDRFIIDGRVYELRDDEHWGYYPKLVLVEDK